MRLSIDDKDIITFLSLTDDIPCDTPLSDVIALSGYVVCDRVVESGIIEFFPMLCIHGVKRGPKEPRMNLFDLFERQVFLFSSGESVKQLRTGKLFSGLSCHSSMSCCKTCSEIAIKYILAREKLLEIGNLFLTSRLCACPIYSALSGKSCQESDLSLCFDSFSFTRSYCEHTCLDKGMFLGIWMVQKTLSKLLYLKILRMLQIKAVISSKIDELLCVIFDGIGIWPCTLYFAIFIPSHDKGVDFIS